MVSLFTKKAAVGGSASSSKRGSRPRFDQLHQAVSPFEEVLPSVDSIRLLKSFKTLGRRHSTQRDQLALLKAAGALQITERAETAEARCEPPLTTPIGNKAGRWKSCPPALSMDFYAPALINCSGLSPFQLNDEVPFVISVTHPDAAEDARSEISLEDVFLYMSTVSKSQGAAPSDQCPNWAEDGWSYPATLESATKSCIPATITDLYQSSDSSISWPTDEDDSDTTSLFGENLPLRERQLLLGKQQRGSAYDDGSDYFKPELTCGGFKFWSEGEIHRFNLGRSCGLRKAARDEENCREANDTDRNKRV